MGEGKGTGKSEGTGEGQGAGNSEGKGTGTGKREGSLLLSLQKWKKKLSSKPNITTEIKSTIWIFHQRTY